MSYTYKYPRPAVTADCVVITKETEQHTHAIIAALQEQKRIIDRLVLLNDEYDRTHAKDLH